jgi:hypothetical protein
MINGRVMNVEDIEVGDILRVEGKSLPEASTLIATAIAIIGKTEIINLR